MHRGGSFGFTLFYSQQISCNRAATRCFGGGSDAAFAGSVASAAFDLD